MSKEIKNENVNPKTEEQQATVPAPEAPVEEKKHPVKDFFKKHSNKIKTGLAIAGAVGVGVAADKIGLKIGNKKKTGTDESSTEAE